MPRVIGVISGKGGVGKTIVAINLAASLVKYYKKRVLLVDANITTPHVGLYLGLYSTPVTLNDALKGRVEIEKAIYEHSSGVHALPASLKYEDLKDVDWHTVKDKTSGVFDSYDAIIMDSSPGFNRESLITLGTCTEAVFVTNPIVHSAADLIKCRDISRNLNVRPLGIALNMVKKKSYEISAHEVEELVELNVMCSIPYDDAVMQSIVKKKPAIELSARVDGEIFKIAKHIAGSDTQIKGPGFFSRLMSVFRV